MILKEWEDLPHEMQCDEVRYYYDILSKHKGSLVLKRVFDIVVSAILLAVLSPMFLVISIAIAMDSKGSVFFLQERVTTYGRHFKIIKFRTMVQDAEKIGSQLTTSNDLRVTKVGKFLRNCRLDEIPQLICILDGDMSFVGTRPEVPKYVDRYAKKMLATLLLPAGVTSETSILYKDEYRLLDEAANVDDTYVNEVLPEKMYYNLKSIEHFNFLHEIATMFRTVLVVCGKKYTGDNPVRVACECGEENDCKNIGEKN